MSERLPTVAEAAEVLRISERFPRRLIAERRIRFTRIGQTFGRKTDAEVWLTLKEAEIRRDDWLDPASGKVRFGDYATSWVSDHVLKPRTAELYQGLLKNHLAPTLGHVGLGDICEADIRR